MGLVIRDEYIAGDSTPHVAVHTEPGQWGWTVSYLPNRDYGRAQAVAAMHLAELVMSRMHDGDCTDFALLDRLADMLDMRLGQALEMMARPPVAAMSA